MYIGYTKIKGYIIYIHIKSRVLMYEFIFQMVFTAHTEGRTS